VVIIIPDEANLSQVQTAHSGLCHALFCCVTILHVIQGTIEFNGNTYSFILTLKHYGGFLAVTISFVSFFFFRHYYKFILSGTLFLGLINLLNFSALNTTVGLTIGSIGVGFQPTSFLIILLTLVINIRRVNSVFKLKPEHAVEFELRRRSEQIEKFKEQYSKLSSEQLNSVLIDNRYATEAKEAAQQLLIERSIRN
jgi:hypothetical protein